VPLANPDASFEVAARHLFRHLREPGRLRRNPLVRRFFGEGSGRMTRAREKAALATIMRIIEDGAESLRRLDVEANEGERAFRQHTIVRRTYFERAPIPEIAADLGLSIRQYYRERALICARIARYVQVSDERVVPSALFTRLDPLRFAMEQSAQRLELGDPEGAARGYVLVLRAGEGVAAKIDALCRLVDAYAALSADDAAAAYVRDARALLASDGYELTPSARSAAHCDIALAASRLEWQTGGPEAAAALLADAYAIAEAIVGEGGKRVRELAIEVLLERGQRSADLGNFGAALDDVLRVGELQRARPDVSLRQRSDAIRLRALFEMTSPQPLMRPAQSFAPLAEALEFARACGSAKRVILATAAFATSHRYSNNERGAADAAIRAATMAQHVTGARFRATVAILGADALAHTRFWKRGMRILYAAEGALSDGSLEAVKFKALQSAYHHRCGRYLESHACAAAAEREARLFGSRRLQGAALRELAMSAHGFGRLSEARTYLREALAAVDEHGSALSRYFTNRVATMIA